MARGATVLSFLLTLVLAAPAAAQAKRDTVATDPLAGRTRGSARAPVTVYEMSDFQCPYCRRFALETFPALDAAYIATGKVRWVFINFPLTSIHPNALAAAELAICAAQQDAFWRVHDLLYKYQDIWAPLKEPACVLPHARGFGEDLEAGAARLRSLAGHPGNRAGGGAGCRALRRQQHAHLLHRRRPPRRRAAGAGVPAGAGFDLAVRGKVRGEPCRRVDGRWTVITSHLYRDRSPLTLTAHPHRSPALCATASNTS